MALALLITPDDFSTYFDLSQNQYSETLINSFIRRAQFDERKYWCNDEFMIDFITNVGDAKYQDLLEGTTYTDDLGDLRIFDGVKPVIIFWTLAKLVKSGYIFSTDGGFRWSNAENTTNLTDEQRKKLYSELKYKAESYEKEVIRFLDSNEPIYPLWDYEYHDRQGILGLYK